MNTIDIPTRVSSDTEAGTGGGRLTYLPVGLFGSVMGLTGLSIAWRLAHRHFRHSGLDCAYRRRSSRRRRRSGVDRLSRQVRHVAVAVRAEIPPPDRSEPVRIDPDQPAPAADRDRAVRDAIGAGDVGRRRGGHNRLCLADGSAAGSTSASSSRMPRRLGLCPSSACSTFLWLRPRSGCRR